MALDKQINLYCVDTNAFLTKRELEIKKELSNAQSKLTKLKRKHQKLKSVIKKLEKIEHKDVAMVKIVLERTENDIESTESEISSLKKPTKHKLLEEFSNVVENKHKPNGKKNASNFPRVLNKRHINVRNGISMFESSLTRSFGIKTNDTTEDIIIVEIYYYDVFKDLLLNGFFYNGKKYIYFSSSAGQIRTKKAVFVREKTYNENAYKLMGGLTIDCINEKGGMNVNKFLAYLALCNSATETWDSVFGIPFDIHKAIVVDDIETNVKCKVDDIDYETYEITPNVEKYMPIPHMDGAGLIDSNYCSKNFMVRLPWIKGLLGSFDFKGLIKENGWSSKVVDIWGKEYDVIKDDIQIIFTKSQLKLYKYYESWDQYKEYFMNYGCEACVCNMEEDEISDAKINYQMLQSLYSMTDEEISDICTKSNRNITELSDSLENMLKIFGLCDDGEETKNKHQSNFQKALSIYPELITDTATKDTIRDLKDSLVNKYRGGKLDIIGKYTFVLSDLVAFCQWLFGKEETPKGVLKDGEVYCRLYKDTKTLDCLRAPSLYIEHAIRENVAKKHNEKYKWFNTDAIYISMNDLISRILQLDVDGDKLLVLAQHNIVEIAKRHMHGVNPLYYEMKKAKSELITKESLYNGLVLAFTGGNIGVISNDITKIWNSGNITENEINSIKWLCMENNFTIDYAKTLFKPTRPESNHEIIKKFHAMKVPYFFQYAKNKELDKCDEINDSVMNKILTEIKDKRLNFSSIKGLTKFNSRMMMHDKDVELNSEIVDLYMRLNNDYGKNLKLTYRDGGNIRMVISGVRNEFKSLGYDEDYVCDVLIKRLYDKPSRLKKDMFWDVYGGKVVENLKSNIDPNTKCCKLCGKRANSTDLIEGKCKKCRAIDIIHNDGMVSRKCIGCEGYDCNETILVKSWDMKTCRCSTCKKEYMKIMDREKKRRKRSKN